MCNDQPVNSTLRHIASSASIRISSPQLKRMTSQFQLAEPVSTTKPGNIYIYLLENEKIHLLTLPSLFLLCSRSSHNGYTIKYKNI